MSASDLGTAVMSCLGFGPLEAGAPTLQSPRSAGAPAVALCPSKPTLLWPVSQPAHAAVARAPTRGHEHSALLMAQDVQDPEPARLGPRAGACLRELRSPGSPCVPTWQTGMKRSVSLLLQAPVTPRGRHSHDLVTTQRPPSHIRVRTPSVTLWEQGLQGQLLPSRREQGKVTTLTLCASFLCGCY